MQNTADQLNTDTVYSTLKKIAGRLHGREIIVLESQLQGHPESNVTFIAASAVNKLVVRGAESTIWRNGEQETVQNNPWNTFREFRKDSGWLFGYIGYDTGVKADYGNRSEYRAPDLFMMEPEYLFKITDGRVQQLLGVPVPEKGFYSGGSFSLGKAESGIERETYITNVRQIKHLISEGEFYELNYSYPLKADFSGDSYELYRKMRNVNPVPFGSYMEIDDFAVCCLSPERFLKKLGVKVMSEPIKGTSARAEDIVEDQKLRDELKSEKNEAENLMIVDLVRHDLSQVCRPGSVKVSKLYEIQSFGTVHQLISRVEGEVAADRDPVDVIEACFPMGSMTGAPKKRVMEAIDDLENYKRGIYSGSIGYFTPDGDFDFNVVIRSAVIQSGILTYPVGGAITGDSDPSGEWSETEIKARVLRAVQNVKGVK